ncbi:hypothetical protein ABH924_001373 [Arthrobacter sp. GAS37]
MPQPGSAETTSLEAPRLGVPSAHQAVRVLKRDPKLRAIRARALESQLNVAYANHSGHEDGCDFLGGSVVAGPDGSLLAAAGDGAALLFAEISTESVKAAREQVPYLRERRPELYRVGRLCLKSLRGEGLSVTCGVAFERIARGKRSTAVSDLEEADGTAAMKTFNSPQDALDWQKPRSGKSFPFPVYEVDGKTLIGEFVIGPTNGHLGGD